MSPSHRRRRGASVVAVFALVGLVVAFRFLSRREASAPPPRASSALATSDPSAQEFAQLARRRAAVAAARARLRPELATYLLVGLVVDGQGRPVRGAEVALGAPERRTTSDAAGKFAFPGLTAGRYSVEARHGARVGGPVHVDLGPSTRPVVLRLYQGAVIEVEVVSKNGGRPISGAEVEIALVSMYERGGVQRGRTGADGKVRFPGATLVAHEVWVGAPGFAEARDTLDPAEAVDGRWTFRIALEPGALVAGQVVDESGRPVAGAVVEPIAATGGEGNPRTSSEFDRYGRAAMWAPELRRRGVVTDPDGRFQTGLGRGTFRLVATHPDYEPSASASLDSDGKTPRNDVQIVLRRGRRVVGYVVTPADEPVPGAWVRARWAFAGRLERTVQADGTGRFELSGLPPAPFILYAATEAAAGTPVRLDLAQAAPEEEILLVLDHDGAITGEVVDARGAPVPDAQIFYVEQAPPTRVVVHPSVVNADGEGRFTIFGLDRSKAYVLNVQRPQDGDPFFRTSGVSAKPGDHVVVRLPDDGTLVGRVALEGGGVPPGARVGLDGTIPLRPVARDGSFRIEGLPPRGYRLRVGAADSPDTVVDVAIEAGKTTDVGVVTLARGRHVAGRVLRPDRQPIGEAEITIRSSDGRVFAADSGPDGRFSMVVPRDTALEIQAAHRRAGRSTAVAVAPGAPATDLELVLQAGGSVEGSVAARGEPKADLFVALFAPGAASPVAYEQTDDSGYFRLEGIPAGSYELEVTVTDEAHRAAVYRKPVTVAVGQRSFVEVDVSRGVEGGEPIPQRPWAPPQRAGHGHE